MDNSLIFEEKSPSRDTTKILQKKLNPDLPTWFVGPRDRKHTYIVLPYGFQNRPGIFYKQNNGNISFIWNPEFSFVFRNKDT